jgi:type IV secretory pathway VirB10-like protein
MNRQTRDERLRRMLREGDPAAGEPGLSPEELREMRRNVLNAIPERRSRRLPAFVWAGAALAALAVLLGALVLRRNEVAPAPAPRVAAVVERTERTAATAGTAGTEKAEKTEEPVKAAKKKPVRHRRRAPAAPAPSVTSESPDRLASAAPVEPEEPQQIQFSTPGGTRIIWVIAPGEASHTK